MPDHDSSTLKRELSAANLTVCNDILVNLYSHNISKNEGIYKGYDKRDLSDYSLQKVTDVYEQVNSDLGKEVYFLNSENEPVKVKSIIKENNYMGKIYDVDVENEIVLVRRLSDNRNLNKGYCE